MSGQTTVTLMAPRWVENQIGPISIDRSNWLYARRLRAAKRAAAVMRLIHSARMNGHDCHL